ncbi:heavy-metal-associated domain-containing protein [Pseudogemmobacter bohemicus]|uniref:heavy-metal-associated domain-containing protein n=1 Tax=Pseudogemmobacter bohemicus TaxID=2250708 RepID=UPI000DD38E46|nr:copper ion binding protein [Pseudogemmobacter bohemicus]
MSETIQFKIEGMDCGSCVKQIEAAVGAVAGVETVKVSLAENNATVSFDPTKTSKAAVIEVVEDEGFDVPA